MADDKRKKVGEEAGEKPDLARRAFLTGSVAAAAGGAVAAAVARGDDGAAAAGGTDTSQPVYRETEHIRRYYAAARF